MFLWSPACSVLLGFSFPNSFTFSTCAFYSLLLRKFSTVPILPRQWASFVLRRFSLVTHWSLVRDSLSENSKNDLAWFISMQAIKVTHLFETGVLSIRLSARLAGELRLLIIAF